MFEVLDCDSWLVFEHQLGRLYWRSSLRGHFPTPCDTSDPTEWAAAQQGNWGAVFLQADRALLLCDQARSIPLFYYFSEGAYQITSDINVLIARNPDLTLNPEAAAEFRHFGYVLGNDTLLSGVYSAPSGTVTTLSLNTDPVYDSLISPLRAPESSELSAVSQLSTVDFLKRFHAELCKAFRFTIDQAQGRQLLIPLSGGADSRLLLAILKELNAPNVLCFTYGQAGSKEAQVSETVARGLGFEWIFVELEAAAMRKAWGQAEGFVKYCWAGQSLTHIQDWYALLQLQNHPAVEKNAIVLPGHTIVGNEHDEWCANPQLSFSPEDAVKLYIEHHGVLQGKPQLAASEYTKEKLRPLVKQYWTGTADNRLETLVALNVRERQAKYISHSVRAYEFFGFDWAFPMYERGVWDLWINAPQQFHEGVRVEYVRYANELYQQLSGVELDFFKGVTQDLPVGLVQRVKTVLVKTGLLSVANHVLSVRAQLNHPMGFHALVGDMSRARLVLKLAGGATLLGVYANSFLSDRWVLGSHILPPFKG